MGQLKWLSADGFNKHNLKNSDERQVMEQENSARHENYGSESKIWSTFPGVKFS